MLSRKSAVISKLSVTRDSLMRSPLLLPVCLPSSLHSLVFTSFICLPLPVKWLFFAVKAFFCLRVCTRARETVCLKSTCRGKRPHMLQKKAPSVEGTESLSGATTTFILRCVQLQRSVSKARRQSSCVKARPFVLKRRTMKRMMRCWIKQ